MTTQTEPEPETGEYARVERRITLGADGASAWSAVVDGFETWFGSSSSLDPREGGSVRSGDRRGTVTECIPHRRLCWEWSQDGDPGWARVEIALESTDEGTDVVVTETLHAWEHERLEALDADRGGPFGVLVSA